MPTMIRTNKYAEKIRDKIIGVPANQGKNYAYKKRRKKTDTVKVDTDLNLLR